MGFIIIVRTPNETDSYIKNIFLNGRIELTQDRREAVIYEDERTVLFLQACKPLKEGSRFFIEEQTEQ